jgi:hypothetical protein
MRSLRSARRLSACREGLIEPPRFGYGEWSAAAAMLSCRAVSRGP